MCGRRAGAVGVTSHSADTIVATATPPGEGGVAIVRLSGSRAESILSSIFRRKGSRPHWDSHRLYLGDVIAPGEEVPVDEALAVVMRSPRSYTREDVVEIHTHGGGLVSREVVQLCVREGARLAQPGEFTLRAFLNGRLDLAQAESVLQVIKARSLAGLRMGVEGLRGQLSDHVSRLRERLLGLMSLLEAELDFGDEVPETPRAEVEAVIEECLGDLARFLSRAEAGRLLSEGVRTVLVGPPNVGKSTLLNALLGEQRALVTPHAGTTRDRLEESVVVEGVLLRLIDTAGIRDSQDPVEELGVALSRDAARKAELIVLILDGSAEWPDLWVELRQLCQDLPAIVALNKRDLGEVLGARQLRLELPDAAVVETVLVRESGVESLRHAIATVARRLTGDRSGCFSLNERQEASLVEARRNLERVREACAQGLSAEFLCADLRPAILAVGAIQGIDVTEEILDRVFSTFCLGK